MRRAGFPFVPLFERLGLNGVGEPELIWRRRLVQAYIDGTFSAALAKDAAGPGGGRFVDRRDSHRGPWRQNPLSGVTR